MTAPASTNARKLMAPPLSLRAEVVPSSINEEARTVDLTWSTGAKVLRSSWWDGPFWEELSMEAGHVRLERLNNGAPLLDSHSGHSVLDTLGAVVEGSARIEGGKGVATVRLPTVEQAGGDQRAEQIWQRLKARFIKNVSIGYRTFKVEKTESADGTAPTHRAIDWEPYEISLVPMGADDGAKVRSAVPLHEIQVITRNITQPKETAVTTPKNEATPTAEANETAIKAAAEAARAAEQARINSINEMLARSGLPETVSKEFGTKFVKDNTPVDEARAAIFDEMVKRQPNIDGHHEGRITVGETDDEKFARGAVAAIISRSGQRALVEKAKAKGVEGLKGVDTDPAHLRGFSAVDLAREALERRGVKVRGITPDSIVSQAFTMGKRDAGGLQGTSDFPVLLTTAYERILLAAYAITPDTWSRFCSVIENKDFQPTNHLRAGTLQTLDALDEHGEFKRKSIPDAITTPVTVDTKGNIYGITRKLIVNDSLGFFADLMVAAGRAAKLTIEKDVYALLKANGGLGPTMADGQPFFHAANRKNVNSTASGLTAAGIDADGTVMGHQTDPSGNETLDLRPSILLVPRGLESTAKVLNTSTFNPDGGSGKSQLPNPALGTFSDIVGTTNLTGTRRYLFVDPSIAAAFVVAFLEGQREPTLETKDGWDVDGTELKVRHDFKAQAFDPKAAVTNAGQ